MNIFLFTDYRVFLSVKTKESRGNLAKLAKILNCQSSYLIRTIDGTSNLTPDQAHVLAENLGFTLEEREYFMTLVNWERAGEVSYKMFLKNQLEQMRERHNLIGKIVKRKEISDSQLLLSYHGDPKISLLHFLTACKDFATLEKICLRLNINSSDALEIIEYLKENNYISFSEGILKYKSGTSHIPIDSPVLPIFLMNWRNYAVQKSHRKQKSSTHYSNLQTIGNKDLQALLELSSQFIRNSKAICDQSGSEDLVVINLDVFKP